MLQYGPILAVLNTTKTNTRIRIFTQEFSLDINYSSPFVQCPHYPIACFQHLCTVAHNCHGKKKNLTAKRKTSRQKEKPHGKKKNLTAKRITSRQKEKPHSKKKNLTAKRITSRQKEKPHGKKEKGSRQNFFNTERTFLLPWSRGYSFCREIILFAVRFFFLLWG